MKSEFICQIRTKLTFHFLEVSRSKVHLVKSAGWDLSVIAHVAFQEGEAASG
jgi:hypothetical protein